jgi:DNA-binding CsgD family transcriptional regulator
LSAREAWAVPAEVLGACRELRAAVEARNPKALRSLPGDVATVTHPRLAGLRAQITVLNNPASALAKPRFLVVLDLRLGAGEGEAATAGGVGGGAGGRMRSLQELSPREREIALLVCEGLSNAEIARQLRKSVLTIKTQLNAVFRKLGVTSRTRLMAMLR